jgi:integrase
MSDRPRGRGGIRRHGNGFQVRISAGTDPVTGARLVLHETVPIAPARTRAARERAARDAREEAERVRTRLLAEADSLRVARTRATLGALLDRWLPEHEVDETTRMLYESQIRNYIKPALGDVPLMLLVREASSRLERFYAQLRRCRQRCAGRPFVEAHVVEGRHDCRIAQCRWHECRPYAASSVRSLHGIISGALTAAVRWGWLSSHPAASVRKPAMKRPHPTPPLAEEMARIVETAWAGDASWGLYIWLSAVTGARRGEVVALQWCDLDLERGRVRLDENYVRGPHGMLLKDPKDPKDPQIRYDFLDKVTVDLLRKHKTETTGHLLGLGIPLTGDTWVFSARPDFSRPRDPSSPGSSTSRGSGLSCSSRGLVPIAMTSEPDHGCSARGGSARRSGSGMRTSATS